MAPTRFECSIPILRVADLRASLRWYTDVLGFATDWVAPPMASVSRDRCEVMLCQQCEGHFGIWVWFDVEDVAPLFEQYRAKGAEVVMPLTNFSWAYEMRLRDPDGNVLRFGSEPRKDLKFEDRAEGGAS